MTDSKLREALQDIVDAYDSRSELYTSDAECAQTLADKARIAISQAEREEFTNKLVDAWVRSGDATSDEGTPHTPAAFINAIADEGSKAEAIEWLQKIWNEKCELKRTLHVRVPREPGQIWSFLRSVLSQGGAIERDYQNGTYKCYEEYSTRLDGAARERTKELLAAPSPPSKAETAKDGQT